jgi:hypothetical protein
MKSAGILIPQRTDVRGTMTPLLGAARDGRGDAMQIAVGLGLMKRRNR